MNLASILEQYLPALQKRYGCRLTDDQRQALHAIERCRTEDSGEMTWQCLACDQSQTLYYPCGHRSCPQCQHHTASVWIERQQAKLLPVDYFMVTFTLPKALRNTLRRHPKTAYSALFDAAGSTLKSFGLNHRQLNGDLGFTSILHTHSRQLEYHPHLHVVIPGAALLKKRRQWRKLKGQYLFNGKALAKVFKARFLETLAASGLAAPAPTSAWVVHCKKVGSGLPALKYLSRYLYRGVISEKNIIANDGASITFTYKDNKDKQQTRCLKGEDFLWLILQHVLPKGFRRVRDYGFLHGNAKKTLDLIRWVLKVHIAPGTPVKRPILHCRLCHHPMVIIRHRPPDRKRLE